MSRIAIPRASCFPANTALGLSAAYLFTAAIARCGRPWSLSCCFDQIFNSEVTRSLAAVLDFTLIGCLTAQRRGRIRFSESCTKFPTLSATAAACAARRWG